MSTKENKTTVSESAVRPSISLHLIRHAESNNNEVYRNARYIYRGGTPEFDEPGWFHYVDTHRRADPCLSSKGSQQAQKLASYMVPHLENQASHPVRIVTSPMRRTLETIQPTLETLRQQQQQQNSGTGATTTTTRAPKAHIIVNAFYHESEGCHIKEQPAEGMNPDEIRDLLKDCVDSPEDIEFVGFPQPDRGWYIDGTGPETRAHSEQRAAKFYLWLCEYLDEQLSVSDGADDLFDAGVQIQGEEAECEHDKFAQRIRKRRTALFIGHGDFMSLVIKRIIAGYGHYVETEGIPHRSAFVHYNTGISEFEYFGRGRFLVMGTNQTPHFAPAEHSECRSGGSLKDGWSYLMPTDEFVLGAEVSVAFSDELEEHVLEQTQALKALYLHSSSSGGGADSEQPQFQASKKLQVEQEQPNKVDKGKLLFVVKRGLQVVGVATYSQDTGFLTDVAVRPSAKGDEIGATLMNAVKSHARKLGRSGSLIVQPRSHDSKSLFESMGFSQVDDDDKNDDDHVGAAKMESKIN